MNFEGLAEVGTRAPPRRQEQQATKILISGAVNGEFESLFAAVAKAHAKSGPFAAVLCTGPFFGPAGTTTASRAPVPTYYVQEQHDRRAPGNCHGFQGKAGVRDIAGLRVGYLAREHTKEDVEALSLQSGAFVAGSGVDVLLSFEAGEGYDALLTEGDGKYPKLRTSKALGPALATIATQYHIVPADIDWTFPGYRAGIGAPRVARLVAVPPRGKPRSLRAFNIEPFGAQPDIDTDAGLKKATILASELREATDNPYLVTHNPEKFQFNHLPPPGLRTEKHLGQQDPHEVATSPYLSFPKSTTPPEDDGPPQAETKKTEDDEASLHHLPVAFGANRRGHHPRPPAAREVTKKQATGLSFSADDDDAIAGSEDQPRHDRGDDLTMDLDVKPPGGGGLHHRQKRRFGAPDGP